ncbi:hypothetical protein GCM10027347_48810 [Larkinella harenae]
MENSVQRIRRTSNKAKYLCTAFDPDGLPLTQRYYFSYNAEGARMQFDEWLERQMPGQYDPEKIEVLPA